MRWSLSALAARLVTGRRQLLFGSLTLTVLLGLCLGGIGSAEPTTAQAKTVVFNGYGFESCTAPTLENLGAWLASPYRAVGIYIGGADRGCANTNLDAAWVSGALGSGWNLIPTYVGLQAPCTSSKPKRFTAANAASEGTAAADDAIAQATTLGLPGGSPLYFDMESYATKNPACTAAVQTFLSAWSVELHGHNYVPGVYGSAGSTIRDLQALQGNAAPDDVWIADWNGVQSVFGDPYVSDTLWTNHQRIHQYRGGHHETYAKVTINVDSDYLDGAVVGATGNAPPPTSPTTPVNPTAPTLTAGTATSGDGQARATWPATAFSTEIQGTLSPLVDLPTIPGYGAQGYGVQLTITDTTSLLQVATFPGPVKIHVLSQGPHTVPLFSADGKTWIQIPELPTPTLTPGAAVGFTREGNGSIDILTSEAGSFVLLPDTVAPATPTNLKARFVKGNLRLSWKGSTIPIREAATYSVTLTNRPIVTLAAGTRRAEVSTFHRGSPSVFRVVATDAAGNQSPPSKPIVVVPTPRPKSVPEAIPAWAFALHTWTTSGRTGPRPAKAPKIVPAWYWLWAAWLDEPFHVRVR